MTTAVPNMAFTARFHVRPEFVEEVIETLRIGIPATRREPGCISIRAITSLRDTQLFFIQSDWIDEAAFNVHAQLPRTIEFVGKMEKMVDQPIEFTRARVIA